MTQDPAVRAETSSRNPAGETIPTSQGGVSGPASVTGDSPVDAGPTNAVQEAEERLAEFAVACDVAVRQFGAEHFKARDPARDAVAIRTILAELTALRARVEGVERERDEARHGWNEAEKRLIAQQWARQHEITERRAAETLRLLDALAQPPSGEEGETTWEVVVPGYDPFQFTHRNDALKWRDDHFPNGPIHRVTRRLVEGGGE